MLRLDYHLVAFVRDEEAAEGVEKAVVEGTFTLWVNGFRVVLVSEVKENDQPFMTNDLPQEFNRD